MATCITRVVVYGSEIFVICINFCLSNQRNSGITFILSSVYYSPVLERWHSSPHCLQTSVARPFGTLSITLPFPEINAFLMTAEFSLILPGGLFRVRRSYRSIPKLTKIAASNQAPRILFTKLQLNRGRAAVSLPSRTKLHFNQAISIRLFKCSCF